MLHRLQQVERIDVGANDERAGKIARERDTLLAGRTAEGEYPPRLRYRRNSGGENLWVSVKRGLVWNLVEAGKQQSEQFRGFAPA